jgi:hypothetical protein
VTTTQRLAAIFAVDLVGYSRLMGEDKAGGASRGVQRQFLPRIQN